MLQEKTQKLFTILAKKVFTAIDKERVREEIIALDLETINLIETNRDGSTALHLACMNNHDTKIVELLLGLGARLNAQNRLGKTPAQFAVCAGSKDNLASLISRNVDLRIQNDSGNNVLHLASTVTSIQGLAEKLTSDEIRQNLRDDGFSNYINCQNHCGKTPLHIAAEFDNAPVLNVLLNCKADSQIKDQNGYTALDLAVQNSKEKAISAFTKFESKSTSEEIFEELLEKAWLELEFRQLSVETTTSPSSSPTPFITGNIMECEAGPIEQK